MRNAGMIFMFIAAVGLCSLSASSSAAPSAFRSIGEKTSHFVTRVHSHRYYDFDDDDEVYDPPPQRGYRDGPPPADDLTPEWLPPPRPANCGEYKYWNGEYCADAREQPPYVGPRW